MASSSVFKTIAICVRAAGSKDQISGAQFGGIYFPARTGRDGKHIPAHWESACFINTRDFVDAQGNRREVPNPRVRIVAWNSPEAKPGKGLADMFAKIVTPGKEFSCSLRLNQYMKRVYVNNVPQVNHMGQPMEVIAYNWIVDGDLVWGDDSANIIAQEIMKYNETGQGGFFSRPADWDKPGTAGNKAWQDIIARRMAEVYQGGPTYGYARIVLQEGQTFQPSTGAGQQGGGTAGGQTPMISGDGKWRYNQTTGVWEPNTQPGNINIPPPPSGGFSGQGGAGTGGSGFSSGSQGGGFNPPAGGGFASGTSGSNPPPSGGFAGSQGGGFAGQRPTDAASQMTGGAAMGGDDMPI